MADTIRGSLVELNKEIERCKALLARAFSNLRAADEVYSEEASGFVDEAILDLDEFSRATESVSYGARQVVQKLESAYGEDLSTDVDPEEEDIKAFNEAKKRRSSK